MNHDSLCPNTPETFHDGVLWPAVCMCEMIGRVRADDEDKFLWKYSAAEQRGYNAGERAGYAAGLRDAVEAVESQWADDPMWAGTNWNNALHCAKEAIEALGGER